MPLLQYFLKLYKSYIEILGFNIRNNKACEKLAKELEENNIRIDLDLKTEPINGKIRQAEIEKIPYTIVIGDKEEKEGTLAVRKNSKITQIKTMDFINQIKKEINERL